MKERIEAIIRHERLSPSQFADALGVQRSGISHILSGRNKPGIDFLGKLLGQFPHINVDWLITGNGSMVNDDLNVRKPPEQLEFPLEEPNTRKPFKIPSKSVQEEEAPVYKVAQSQTEPTPPAGVAVGAKAIERIVVFYKDKSFSEYKPE